MRSTVTVADPLIQDFRRLVAKRPDMNIVSTPLRRATVADVHRLSEAISRRVRTQRVPPCAPVIVRVPNGPAFLAAVLAARQTEHAVVLVDRSVPPTEEGRIAAAMGAQAAIRSSNPWPTSPAEFEVESLHQDRVALPAGTEWVKITSGSSGVPCGVAFTSQALCEDDEALFDCMGLSGSGRFLATIPWSHSYGLSSLAIPCLRRGVNLVIPDQHGLWGLLQAARDLEADFFPTVPAFLSALVALPDPPCWPSSLGKVVSAGAPLPPATATRFRESFRVPVHVFYGSSETGGITFDVEGGAAERGTVGLPIPGVRVEIEEDERVRVSGRALGIRRVPITDDRLKDGVFRTGDRGEFEPSGELRLLGRFDAAINIRGKKVDPEEVERVIAGLRGVDEAVVVAMTDSSGTCRSLRAVVAGDSETLSYETVVAWCREHLAPFKVPRSVLVLSSIPRNERGKVDRETLRRWKA